MASLRPLAAKVYPPVLPARKVVLPFAEPVRLRKSDPLVAKL